MSLKSGIQETQNLTNVIKGQCEFTTIQTTVIHNQA